MRFVTKMICVFAISTLIFSCNGGTKTQTTSDKDNQLSRTTISTRFLFDATKAETAGNADWVICENTSGTPLRYPNPDQTSVTSTTPEDYWQGGLSAWGIALVKKGHYVETLTYKTAITYGNTSNEQDLSKFDVYIVDEPNILFTSVEKTAILNFVKNGGGLFMIADHAASDRNHDGKDSPAIWNDLMSNNAVQTNPFGLTLALTNISQNSTNILNDASNAILNGSEGAVIQLKFHNGATIKLTPTANETAKGLIWQNDASRTSTTKILLASANFFKGRVVLLGDSSPADDGTGNPRDKLYPGWTDANGNHARLHLNASYWLAKLQ